MQENNCGDLLERTKNTLRQAYPRASSRHAAHSVITANQSRVILTSVALLAYYSDPRSDLVKWEHDTSEEPSHPTNSDGSLEWVAAHLSELTKEYPDRWILVNNETVVADSADIGELMNQALKLGIASPLIIDTQSPSITSRTAYNAGQDL